MDTKQLYELARDVESAKNNLATESTRFNSAKYEYEKAQQLLAERQQRLTDFLNGASGE